MNFKKLTFKTDLYSSLTFDELKTKLSSRIGTHFKLGFINSEEINLYYLKDVYTHHGFDRIPACEIKIFNKVQQEKKTKIIFQIAVFYLVFTAFIPLIFIGILYITNAPILFEVLYAYPILYLILMYIHTDQSNRFKKDLVNLEKTGEGRTDLKPGRLKNQ